jgi:RNA polymerase sigma-70 factor (ECF subfamily)
MFNLQDPSGFAQMYEEYFRRIYNFVFFRLLHKEQTEDLVSQIFMKVLTKKQSYDERKGSFNTWIFTIARNTLNDFYRWKKAAVSFNGGCIPELAVDFEEQSRLIADEELRELYLALAGLDERTRQVLTLKYFAKFTNREISAQTGINESTVSTLCSRGIGKLQRAMESRREAAPVQGPRI